MSDKTYELIMLYEHFRKEMRSVVDDKIVVLDEVSELLQAINSIEERLEELYAENNNVEIT